MVTQLALDPRGTVVVRRNLLKNPSGRRTLTGYVALGGTLGQDANADTYCTVTAPASVASAGVQIEQLTVGVGLTADTDYTLMIDIGAIGGSSAQIFVLGAGLVADVSSTTVAPDVGLMTRTVTFTTASAGPVTVYVLNGSAAATGNTIYWRDALLGSAGTYFDGNTAAVGDLSYAWTGAPDNSPSIEQTVDPDTVSAAILTVGYEVTRQVNTIVHDVPNAAVPPVTFKGAQSRSGTLQFLFSERETCRRAEIIHTRPGYITITDTDWPDGGMRYVAQGDVTSQLDPDTQVLWLLTTGFREA